MIVAVAIRRRWRRVGSSAWRTPSGLIIAALAAYKAHGDREWLRRNFALAAAGVAGVLLIVIAVAPG
jgi:hypothetical protein